MDFEKPSVFWCAMPAYFTLNSLPLCYVFTLAKDEFMKVFASAKEAVAFKGSVIAIGNFDGVHRGHLALIDRARAMAKSRGTPFGVLSFWPHPTQVLAPNRAPKLVYSRVQKRRVLEELGVDFLIEETFDRDFASTPPRAFVDEILAGALSVRGVVVGHDFSFGSRGAGGPETLRAHFGDNCAVLDAVLEEGTRYSSTAVRDAVRAGEMRQARALLSRDFSIDGVVVHGDGRGNKIGFPTLNLQVDEERIHPAHGVYAIWARAGGQRYEGVANVGIRPTFEDESFRLEAHLFDVDLDLYGQSVEIFFVQYLRSERAFNSVEELKNAIKNDVLHARKVLSARALV